MTTLRGTMAFAAGIVSALALGWVAFPRALYVTERQPISFSHAVHAGETAGMTCEDCHAFRDDGRLAGLPGVEICAGCHQEAVGESAEEKRLVEEFVATGREIPWKIYARQPDHVHFPHATHVKLAELPCESCHGLHGKSGTLRPFERNRLTGYSRAIEGSSAARLFVAARQGGKMSDCSDCHRARGVEESCLDCHK